MYLKPEEAEDLFKAMAAGKYFFYPMANEQRSGARSQHEAWLILSERTLRAKSHSPVEYFFSSGGREVKVRLYVYDIDGIVGEPPYSAKLSTRPFGRGIRMCLHYPNRQTCTIQTSLTIA